MDTVEDGEATCWVQDESHRKSVTGGLGLDVSETTDGSCESECGLRRGARGTGEIHRSVMAISQSSWRGRSKRGPKV